MTRSDTSRPLSPVVQELFDHNLSWSRGKTAENPDFFCDLAKQQLPRFLWIGCSDSRVPANEIIGLEPGDVFVHRNISNIIHSSDMNMLSVVEYAVVELKVPHIIICGHYGCGGVQRALEDANKTAGRNVVDHWLTPIVDLYNRNRALFDASYPPDERRNRLSELNVLLQMRNLAMTPILKNAWAQGIDISIHGWIYGLKDGLLRELGTTISSYDELLALPPVDTLVAEPPRPLTPQQVDAIVGGPAPSGCCGEGDARTQAAGG